MKKGFKKELESLINTYCMDKEFIFLYTDSDTPDYILAEYMVSCLKAFNKATRERDAHLGIR
jgi:hypothetical protein